MRKKKKKKSLSRHQDSNPRPLGPSGRSRASETDFYVLLLPSKKYSFSVITPKSADQSVRH